MRFSTGYDRVKKKKKQEEKKKKKLEEPTGFVVDVKFVSRVAEASMRREPLYY